MYIGVYHLCINKPVNLLVLHSQMLVFLLYHDGKKGLVTLVH